MSAGAIPVLLYHAVDDRALAAGSWGAVSRAQFVAHVEAIANSGRVPLTVSALAAGLRGEQALPPHAVAITFDDGYADTYEAAALLGRRGLSCSVYVTTGKIGARDRLSASQLLALARMPTVELGAHAVRHRHLDELTPRELAAELGESRLRLEQLTAAPIESFAYPHGAFDRSVRAAVIAAGYRSAAAVKNALCHRGDDPFAIARWTVTAASQDRLAEVLAGNGAPLSWRGERLRTRAHRLARRQRRRLRTRRAPC